LAAAELLIYRGLLSRTAEEPGVVAELMYIGLVILLVLIAACALLGIVYCYIYHIHINPIRSSRGHVTSGSGQAGGGVDDVTVTTASNAPSASTHLMLFRKS